MRLAWEPKVSLGNVLTIIGMLAGAVALLGKMETRAATLEVRQEVLDKRSDRFEDEIIKRLDRIENRLEARRDR